MGLVVLKVQVSKLAHVNNSLRNFLDFQNKYMLKWFIQANLLRLYSIFKVLYVISNYYNHKNC
jgi:hypothetical protein